MRDFELSGQWLREILYYGMWRRVVWYKFTGISEETAASIFYCREKRGSGFLRKSLNLYQTTRRYISEIFI